MAKYVDVEKVFCADCEDRDRCGSPDVFCDVHSMPAADVATVVHGEWIDNIDENGFLCNAWRKCSACGGLNYSKRPPFCPNCGADMRERKGDDA